MMLMVNTRVNNSGDDAVLGMWDLLQQLRQGLCDSICGKSLPDKRKEKCQENCCQDSQWS